MAEGERTQALTFLYKVIDDNQATIRFLDTKAAFGIAMLGAIVSKLIDPDQMNSCRSHGPIAAVVSVVLTLLVVLSAFLGFRVIFPVIDPAENVSLPDEIAPRFFISEFDRKSIFRLFSSRKRFCTLKQRFTDYFEAVERSTTRELEASTTAEVLKLSFIRQLKTDRLYWFARTMIATIVAFVFVMALAPKAAPAKEVQVVHESLPQVIQVPQAPRHASAQVGNAVRSNPSGESGPGHSPRPVPKSK